MPPNPACRSLSRQDFKYRSFKPLTRPEQPEHSCRWQLWNGPLRRNHLGQKHVLYALVDPVSAPLVEPPGTAPGSDRFITTPVYRHSRPLRDGRANIGAGVKKKGLLGSGRHSGTARSAGPGIHSLQGSQCCSVGVPSFVPVVMNSGLLASLGPGMTTG